jgi:hypothetical protein
VPRCYPSVVLAARSHPSSAENRLTEIYAIALETQTGFAARVFELAGLRPATAYRAYTQEALPDRSGRLDLVVRGVDADENVVSLLYAEHKEPGGSLQADQPGKYLPFLAGEKRRRRVPGEFLVIVTHARKRSTYLGAVQAVALAQR